MLDRAAPKQRTNQIQPLDVLVLLKLAATGREDLSVRELGRDLGGLPKSTVDVSVRRLRAHGLVREHEGKRQVNRLLARDLIEKAIRWLAPADVGRIDLGVATAHAAAPLAGRLMGDAEPVVMRLSEGPVRGRTVTPLHPNAPLAASRDPRLHELLAIVDALRIGRARDREVAIEELRARL